MSDVQRLERTRFYEGRTEGHRELASILASEANADVQIRDRHLLERRGRTLRGRDAHGDSQETASRNINDAMALWIDTAKEDGHTAPRPAADR